MKELSVTSAHIYHDALRQRRLAVRYSDDTEEDMPLEDFIHQRDDAKDDAHRMHKEKMAFLERLLTCRLRCGYIINHCRDHAQAKGEAEEMLRVIEGIVPPSPRPEGLRHELMTLLRNIARSRQALKVAITEKETREDLKGDIQMALARAKQNLDDDVFALLNADFDLDAALSPPAGFEKCPECGHGNRFNGNIVHGPQCYRVGK